MIRESESPATRWKKFSVIHIPSLNPQKERQRRQHCTLYIYIVSQLSHVIAILRDDWRHLEKINKQQRAVFWVSLHTFGGPPTKSAHMHKIMWNLRIKRSWNREGICMPYIHISVGNTYGERPIYVIYMYIYLHRCACIHIYIHTPIHVYIHIEYTHT